MVDLQQRIQTLLDQGVPLLSIVVIEEHPEYTGELVFQVFEGEHAFYSRYKDWISCYCVLSELFNLDAFLNLLEADGWSVVFGDSTEAIMDDYSRWSLPLKIEGYDLHPFQQFSLNRAFETDFWFFNWATGAGKSFVCAAGAKELITRDECDVVIMCTLPKSKINQVRFFEKAGLDVVVNDGTKDKRTKVYAQRHQVYVMNYEKLWVDYEAIRELTIGRKVLWIFDETHKVVTGDYDFNGLPKQNKSRVAFEKLTKTCGHARIWPMSASVVNGNPLRFRDVFAVGRGSRNPLGTKADFEKRYADEIKVIPIKIGKNKNKTFDLVTYDWNLSRLQEVRHRVGHLTQTARKTDPGVAPYFKGLQTLLEPIQMGPEEAKICEEITDVAWAAYQNKENMGPYYSMLRYVCNTPQALLYTNHEPGKLLAEKFRPVLSKLTSSAKLDRLNEHLESIRESGDQVLVFTHFTTLTLHLIEDKIEVPHVVHYGTGQSDKESQKVQDDFKSNPDITCFLTSDAGAHGLNMQNARYVIQLEPTYSYDDGMQRASRIDRSDSHLDGLTNYVYVTEGSVEERVWDVQQARREISAAIQGTQEVLSHGELSERAQRTEQENFAWLLFGDRA